MSNAFTIVNKYRKLTTCLVVFIGLAAFFLINGNDSKAAGTITGRAFQDFNASGVFDNTGGTAANPTAIDVGVLGITVTVYDSAGVQRGSTTTLADGTYSLAATGTGPYRVEFTNLPTGFTPSFRSNDSVLAGTATNAGSTVHFVNDGNTSNVNLAVNRSEEYCQNNPKVAISCFVQGAQNGGNANLDVLVDFPYWAGTVYTDPISANYDIPFTHPLNLRASQIGATFSLAYSRNTRRLYASSFFKKHVGFGPGADSTFNTTDDPGAIYVINPSTNTVTNTFTVPNATTNAHDTSNYNTDNGNIGWDGAGKTSLGGIALAEDLGRLFVMNLQNRTLYALNPTTGAVIASQAVPTSTVPTPSGTAANCAAGDVRPFAVRYYRQQLFVGMVCSAESTQNTTNMRAYVYQVNPTTLAFGGSPAFQTALNYPRGFADPGWTAAWRPWFATIVSNATAQAYPQAVLSDIEFDGENLILGVRDRVGDQANDFDANRKRTAGETIKACGTIGAWTLESNGRCGGTGTAPQGTGQGFGNGEFYYQDDFSNPENGANFHDEVSWGTLLRVPGTTQVLSTVLDPISRMIDAGATFDGGIRWFNNTTGATNRAYRIYNGTGAPNVPDLGKANGLGDMAALCDRSPIEIGNRVWLDANNNGIQDPGETPINNVALELWADTDANGSIDAQIGSTTTNANGHYIFNSSNLITAPVCGTNFGVTEASVNASSDDAEQDISDNSVVLNSPDLDIMSNEGAPPNFNADGLRFNNLSIPNGATITNAFLEFTANTDAAVSGGSLIVTVQGQAADNPTTFTTANNNINGRPRTVASVAWNPPVWTPNSIQQTSNLSGIVQELVNRPGWVSGNSMAFILSSPTFTSYREARTFDATASSVGAPRLVIQYSTPATCAITPNTNYEVRIPSPNFSVGALIGLTPTLPVADMTANGTSRDSDGIVISGSQVLRAFTAGGAGDNNHTFDFGFKGGTNVYSVGNRVWFDTNNDGRINAAEVGISGISVSLFVDANSDGQPDTPGSPVGTIPTDSTGYYRFDNLNAGTYVVRVNPSNFASGQTLFGHQNTTGNTVGDVDSDLINNGENGINPTAAANTVLANGILSNTITLGPGTSEPMNETDLSGTGQGSLDNLADMTVDFGFYCMSLSGTLWNDTGAGPFNNNGQLDPGETPIPTIRVRLFDAGGVEVPVGFDGILGTADDGLTGTATNGSGNYNFRCLPQGQYRVVVGGSSGVSSTPTSLTPDDNIDNDDNGLPGTGQFNGLTVSNLVTLTPGSAGALGNNTVTNTTGLTSNPTVDFGFITAPTFIKLEGFEVNVNGIDTQVKWSTAEESDNLGFNVYREIGGKRELVNRSIIAGGSLRTSASLVATGDSYSWLDDKPQAGAVYYLEDIDMKGSSTMHGPVYPKISFSASSLERKALLLSELGRSDGTFGEKEYVGFEKIRESEKPKLRSAKGDLQGEIASQRGVKLAVDHDAWYRVTATELGMNGFNTGSNRDNWQLFANGEEVPMKVVQDGSIEFFGSGNDRLSTDKKIYYLVEGSQPGRRLTAVDGGSSDVDGAARSFEMTTVREDRQVYISTIRNGEEKNFFGAVVQTAGPTLQTLTVRNMDDQGQIRLRVRLQGLATGSHLVGLRLNGIALGTVSYSGEENRVFEYNLPLSYIAEGVNTVELQSVGPGTDVSFVDSISLTYPRRFIVVEDQLRMTVPAGQGVRVGGFDRQRVNTEIEVYEIENGRVERQLLTSLQRVDGLRGISLSPANHDRELLVLDHNRTQSVANVTRNIPTNWRSASNRADLVIIAPESLRGNAEQLAVLRRGQKLETQVVLAEDIYDEFGFGEHSPEAIREFMRAALTSWELKPRYAILFGDSSADPRNYLGQVNRDLVPTKLFDTAFQETGSDAWLADFNDDGIEDIALGRLPAVNAAEANIIMSKIAQYEAQTARPASSVMIADRDFGYYNDVLQTQLPAGTQATRIERSTLTDAEMRSEIITRLNAGPTVVTYTGHGAPGIWAGPGVFTTNDVVNINNEKLSVYLMMTCLNGYIMSPFVDSISESFLKSPNGGAIAVWASTGSTYPDVQLEISRTLTGAMFTQNNVRLGDMIRASKQTTNSQDVRRTWHLIGDPTMFVK